MATIDYKEKYEQAMERARQFFEKPYLEDSAGIVRHIFPEFAESEDERIRKSIIELLNEVHFTFKYYDINKMLAWLEKQGKHAKFWDSIQVGDKVTRNQDGVLVNLSRLKRVAKRDEKQGEQKPAEWSEEDEVAINMAIIALEDMYSENEPETTYAGFSLPFDKAASRLKSLRPQSQWKPSDEQMDALNDVISSRDIKYDILSELWKDLKKLMEE